MIKKSFLYLLFAIGTVFPVEVSINSGDPVFPFPQFAAYENETTTYENLASKPGVGVTHAEMEQVIRDGYQIMMNRAEKTGDKLDGKDYIKYLSNPQCSEGDGYGLLGAASMADKETFDGLWLYIHDFTMNKVKRYSDCKDASPGYNYSRLPGWTGSGANSAADGDFDIALALLIAYKQWGEFMGIDDACGEPISYKYEAIEFIKALTDTLIYSANGNYLCGDIGLDGYIKGGDSWAELTNWASNTNVSGFPRKPDAAGPTDQHIDYAAPAYFRAFADFLAEEDSAKYAWNIYQFRRGEASSDWLMGKMIDDDEKTLPHAGWVELSADNVPTYTSFSDGEDFRCSWRTILNEVWHGNPSYTWDPEKHQIKTGTSNSFEENIGKRYASFLWDSRQEPWNNECVTNVGGDKTIGFWGPEVLKYWYSPSGEPLGTFALNWVPGTGSPAAVVSQNHDLMAELYRCLEMKWDGTGDDRYLGSVPHYFHGWFRMLGLLVLSGNHHSPLAIKPTANMKVYLDIDKTFAFEGDTVTYTIDYRNYGSLDAKDVVIKDTLHKDFVYISSTGNGKYNEGSNTVTWSLGTIDGVNSKNDLDDTKGQVKLTVKVGTATQEQYRNKVSITCDNGSGWVSNEYPNNITAVMERNYLDIAKRALIIDKNFSNTAVNPGKELEVTIDFENTSKAGWINGGRPGVQFSYSADPQPNGVGSANKMRFRLFHDADEAYIDYGNYRVSYFLFDAGNTCYKDESGDCNNGWQVSKQISEGVKAESTVVLHQTITAGSDEHGKWNQKIVLQFSDVNDPNRQEKLTTTTYHLDWYRGVTGMIHRGGVDPLRFVWDIHNGTYTDVDWGDDWSWSEDAVDGNEESRGFPITNDWTDPDNPNIPVNTYNPKECVTTSKTVDNILVEEWDGYTWRRVAGNGPIPGRDVLNVVIKDTIPSGLTFVRFEGKAPFGIEPELSSDKKVITWKIDKLQVQEKGTIKYVVTANGACPMQDKFIKTKAWASAEKESPVFDEASVNVTCDYVEPPLPPPTTMYKYDDKDFYKKGDTIEYTIGYKQTHGSVFEDASDIDDWISLPGKGKLTINSGTIAYNKPNAGMVYKYSYFENGTISGTIVPTQYTGTFSLIVRQDENDYVELLFNPQWDDIKLSISDNSKEIYNGSVTYTNFPKAFDFKIKLSEDSLSFWAGDTSALIPTLQQTGVSVRAGYSGVMSGKEQSGTTISNWQNHVDGAYDVIVTDRLPEGLSFISASGEISTGDLKGTKFNGKLDDRTITWKVVSDDDCLNYNDSITLKIKAKCNDFPRDSLTNTAFTNLRGYPQNQIGARVTSEVFVQAGDPHHLDIIVDTTKLKLRQDEPFNTLTMEQGMKSLVIYAVVRDNNNIFIEYADNSKWKSRDEDIAEVNKQSSPSGSCLITKTGEGKTIVVVSQDGLLSDSIEITAIAPPPWPVIVSAKMEDDNGDIVPDQLRIVLTDTPKDNQSIIRVLIDYNGNTYNIPFEKTELEDTVLTVPFVSITGKDPVPEGNVTVVLSVDKSEKRENAKITDGVGPAILSAMLGENPDGKQDTLSIVFTEEIRGLTQSGQPLQLISKSSGDTSLLTIEKIISFQDNKSVTVLVTSDGERPAELDSLRLVPGTLGSKLTDNSGNKVHRKNKPVALMGRPALFKRGYYVDNNADGVIDSIYMRFSKDVDLSGMLLSLSWGGIRLNKLSSKTFEYGDSKSIVVVPLPDTFKTNAGIKTSGTMYPLVEFELFPNDSRNGEIADSAAPVITSAVYTAGTSYSDSKIQPDTLRVTFSEEIRVNTAVNPFRLKQKDTRYTLDLDWVSTTRNQAVFTVSKINEIDYPSKSDSIWINPKSAIDDLNTRSQNNSLNKRSVLTVNRPNVMWDVIAAPNPFYYEQESPKKGITIRIQTPSNTKLPTNFHEAYIDIYDALGNRIIKNGKFKKTDDGIDYLWNGRNRRGRQIASGTYLGIVNVYDDGAKGQKRIKLALKWKK